MNFKLQLLVLLVITTVGSVRTAEVKTGNATKADGFEVLLGRFGHLLEQKFNQLEAEIRKQGGTLDNLNKTLLSVLGTSTVNTSVEEVSKKRGELKVFVNETRHEHNWNTSGWMLVQSRFNGSVDFYKDWSEYRNGFGSLDGEFWLGLEKLHLLTSARDYQLLVHLEDFNGVRKYARYGKFAIGGESEQYVLKTLGPYKGTAGDSLKGHQGHKFSTYDRDNDSSRENCAIRHHGAWWYSGCYSSNLNGLYNNDNDQKAIIWYDFNGNFQGLKISKMMIREV